MTEHRNQKQLVRDYARDRGITFQQARDILYPGGYDADTFPIRQGIDDIIGPLVHHPKIDMCERHDGRGYMNGSLTPEVQRSWIPLLDLLTDERWELRNSGPGINNLALRTVSLEEEGEGANHAIYVGESVHGQPFVDMALINDRLGAHHLVIFEENDGPGDSSDLIGVSPLPVERLAETLNEIAARH